MTPRPPRFTDSSAPAPPVLMAAVAIAATALSWTSAPAAGQTDDPSRSIKSVKLTPSSQASRPAAPARGPTIDDWEYRVERGDPRDGVPWRLIAAPVSRLAEKLRPAGTFQPPALAADVPVVKVPEQVWLDWFGPEMKDVVGIHYHEFVGGDTARILMTVHKVPPDGPDGRPPADYRGKPGTRLEATLLTPLSFHLDQSIVVRGEAIGVSRVRKKDAPRDLSAGGPPTVANGKQAASDDPRALHEQGHAAVSLPLLIESVAGPQSWNPTECTGQRSSLTWYWSVTRPSRRWEGYRGGSGKLAAQRLTITLAPPTRWSMLIPLPPDEVPQRRIVAFNDWIANPQVRFNLLDQAAQEHFHALHGAYEGCG